MAASSKLATQDKSDEGSNREVNEVHLIGRISVDPVSRDLPSGDRVVTWRLVVARPKTPVREAGVDTIDCAAWSASIQRKAERLVAGSEVQVSGHLRRRFWRTPAGPASRYEVEVTDLRRC